MSNAANEFSSAGREFRRTDNRQQVASEAIAAPSTRHGIGIVQGTRLKEHQALGGTSVFVHLSLLITTQFGQTLNTLPERCAEPGRAQFPVRVILNNRRRGFQGEQFQGFVHGPESQIQFALKLHNRQSIGGGLKRVENLLDLAARWKSRFDK